MPVQMVCDSTSLVSAALRDSLTSSGSSGGNGSGSSGLGGGSSMSAASSSSYGRTQTSSYFGVGSSWNSPSLDDDSVLDNDRLVDRLESRLSDALRRKQLKPIRYEEVPNYSSELDCLKSKYIVLTAPTANQSNGSIGGGGAAGAINGSTNTQLINGGGGGRGTPSSSKLSATCNGISQQNGNNSSSSPAAGKDQLPAPKRVLYPRENVQLGWKATGHKWSTGAGFTNVGNTCYLNSTLQALFHVPTIANWLLSDAAHREKCDGQGCIICAMAKTLMASQNSQGSIKPYMVVSKLQLVCKHLVPGRQEDAHEFLRYLVEAMEKSYLARFKNSKELDQYSKETTPLNQILGGYLRSEVKCLSCHHVSTTFQHFEDLLLDIRKVNSIEEALTTYFARERLEEMQYKCEACKKKVAATKQFSLERAPFALCIQLKRFSMMGGKINKHVELKTRLDLTPYSSKSAVSNVKLTYKLVSMVTHLGSTQHCGHYTAIGGTDGGTYYVFDDSLVRPISLQNVTSTNAYIIFYELESVQNGIKPSASSTATSASFSNTFGSPSGKYGSSFEGGSNSSGANAHTSPLRGYGPGSNSGHNPLLPSKLENRPNFIGPMLPQQTTQEKTKKLANGLSLYDDDEGAADKSISSRVSPVSSSTSSLSCPSPVKQSCPNGPSSSASKLVRNSPISSNAKSKFGSSFNGIANATGGSSNNNGSFKSSSSPAASSSSTHSLPSMPKLCNSPSATKNYSNGGGDGGEPSTSSAPVKGAGFSGHSKTNGNAIPNGHHHHNGGTGKSVSLVPYDADDDEDDDGENEENQMRPGGSKKRSNGRNQADEEDDDDSDEDVDRIQSHVLLGPANNNRQQQRSSNQVEEDYSPKSPPVIKTKAGFWKVSDNRPQTSSSSSSSSANNSSNNSPATSGNSSPANYGHMNGNGGGPLASGYQPNNRQYNGFNNGYNGNHNNNRNGSGNDVINQLYQFSHRGYGAPVRSWNGQQTNMDRELSNERREDRKRQYEDDFDTEMDRGRTKKVKTHFYHQQQRQQQQQNPFQMHQMNGGNGGGNINRKWNNNNNNNNGNQFGGKYYQNRGGNYYQNGNHNRNYNGFRNGRHGRNGFYNKSHHHHQRDKF